MSNVKVNLTMLVLGAKPLSEQECSKQLTKPVIIKKGKLAGKQARDKQGNLLYYHETVPDLTKFDKHVVKLAPSKDGERETIVYYTRKNREVRQVINISEEAYEYYVSTEVPSGFHIPAELRASLKRSHESFEQQAWKKLSKEERLVWHLKAICDSMRGRMESYTVFDD